MKRGFLIGWSLRSLAILVFMVIAASGVSYVSANERSGYAIAQYPDLFPPKVVVSAQYPGANAETVAQAVAVPLEQQINGVQDMIYMQSTSNALGDMRLTITFRSGTDPDQAISNINDRVQKAIQSLPEAVQRLGIEVKPSPTILGMVLMQSNSQVYDQTSVAHYALLNVVDDLKHIKGVDEVQVLGNMEYSMRIWLHPDKLEQYGLTSTDVINAVNEQTAQYSVGRIGDKPDPSGAFTYSAVTQGHLITPEQFGNIILRSDENAASLKLGDVVRIELGAQQYFGESKLNSAPKVPIMIYLQSGANAFSTMKTVKEHMARLSTQFPSGVSYAVPYDATRFTYVSDDTENAEHAQ